jgi:hypothetical protein
MKITLVVSGEDNLSSAGVRIRYNRLIPKLESRGHETFIVPISDLRASGGLDSDVYLFCKCHDVRSVILAGMMRHQGAQVGIDIFDDYFSQAANPRFVHLRNWLRAITPNLTFGVCSTPRMQSLMNRLMPGLPSQLINDPFDSFDADAILSAVETNVEQALRTRVIKVGWFGMGDNPHFPVGVQDLHAFAAALRSCRELGFEPNLSILTNRRALNVDRLEMIARLGVPFHLEEWEEALERRLIRECLFCFLPVNAQAFSIVKSLNRAVTTLSGGSQVLSMGFPLYSDLEPFIYRDIQALLADLDARTPALRRETIEHLAERLESKADPSVEADRLLEFLSSLPKLQPEKAPIYAAIHGRQTSSAVHKQIQNLGHLSIASPFQSNALAFDLRLTRCEQTKEPVFLLSRKAKQKLEKQLQATLNDPEVVGNTPVWKLPMSSLPKRYSKSLFGRKPNFVAADLAEYDATMAIMFRIARQLFGDVQIVFSELDSPYWSVVFSTPEMTNDDEKKLRSA